MPFRLQTWNECFDSWNSASGLCLKRNKNIKLHCWPTPLRQVYYVNSTSLNPNQPGLIKHDQTSSNTCIGNHASPSEYILHDLHHFFMFSITPCCHRGVLQQSHRSLDVEEGEPSAPRSHVAGLSDGESTWFRSKRRSRCSIGHDRISTYINKWWIHFGWWVFYWFWLWAREKTGA